MFKRLWTSFLTAWKAPEPPRGECPECKGTGKRWGTSTCPFCNGAGSTAPPIWRVVPCDNPTCFGGRQQVDFGDGWVPCNCEEGDIVNRMPWNPPTRRKRLLNWLLRRAPWHAPKRPEHFL